MKERRRRGGRSIVRQPTWIGSSRGRPGARFGSTAVAGGYDSRNEKVKGIIEWLQD